MHEYSVALSIADLVIENSQGKRIEKVNLTIGDLSGISFDSLEMYLQLIFKDKGYQSVLLDAQFIPATFVCACGWQYVTANMAESCRPQNHRRQGMSGGKH
jgi:Zn finger protein HypA/HybF involved in hydrogenase expression